MLAVLIAVTAFWPLHLGGAAAFARVRKAYAGNPDRSPLDS
jgi:hypothetical protein